jgi:hypothetical protein
LKRLLFEDFAMSTTPSPELAAIVRQLPDAHKAATDSFDAKSGEGYSEKVVDAIEMIGEETAAGMPVPTRRSEVTAGMRYLHSSRTIHELVTDRNRAVGIFLGVASLLVTASSALINANPSGDLIIPFEIIKRWCLPITFGALTALALFVALLLIRTRVGLIYEVAKMNALLGLPVGRVQRIAPFSIFFIMQALISLAGGACGGLFSIYMMYLANPEPAHVAVWAALIGLAITAALMALYVVTVNHTTSDRRLQNVGK